MWAYATLGEKPDVRCLDALASFACRNLKEFSPQNISNSAWAMATLQYKNMVCCTASPACVIWQHWAENLWQYEELRSDCGLVSIVDPAAMGCSPGMWAEA